MLEISGYYIVIEVMKDVMFIDIQQCRVPAYVSAVFPASLSNFPRHNKKYGASGRKPDFLCAGGTEISGAAYGIRSVKLHGRAAPGEELTAEGQG